VKDEAVYIAEWIEYHLLVGVTKFYIYDNGSTDNLKNVLSPYIKDNIVEYIFYPGKNKQTPMCNNVCRRARKNTFWLAILDIDEFLVPVSAATIPEYLKNFEDVPGIEINWVLYGSSGHKEKMDGLVIERFKAHSLFSHPKNRHVKTIHNPRAVWVANCHNAIYFFNRKSVNTDKKENKKHFFEREGRFDKLRVNHYFGKSEEEYRDKIKRGWACRSAKKRTMESFYEHDRNEIEDTIMDKYISIIKTNLEHRFCT
jgi:hypothetical protein